MTFGALLRTTRLHLDVSSEAVALELGVHHETVCRWERGEWMPAEAITIVRAASFLAVDPMPLLVAWGRERDGFPLPPTGDDRDVAAVTAMLCWAAVPTEGAVMVTLQPGEDPLKIVRGPTPPTLREAQELAALFREPAE